MRLKIYRCQIPLLTDDEYWKCNKNKSHRKCISLKGDEQKKNHQISISRSFSCQTDTTNHFQNNNQCTDTGVFCVHFPINVSRICSGATRKCACVLVQGVKFLADWSTFVVVCFCYRLVTFIVIRSCWVWSTFAWCGGCSSFLVREVFLYP